MKKKVIDPHYQSTKFPGMTTLTAYLFLHTHSFSGVVHGIIWTFIAVLWLGAFINFSNEIWVHPKDVKRVEQ